MLVCLRCRTKQRAKKGKIGVPQHNPPCVQEGCRGTTSEVSRNTYGLATTLFLCGFEVEKTEVAAIELQTSTPFVAIFLTVSLVGYYPPDMWVDLPAEYRVCYTAPIEAAEQCTLIYNDSHDVTLFKEAKKGIKAEIKRVAFGLKNWLLMKQANGDFEIYALAGWVR